MSQAVTDPYAVLGVGRNATAHQLARAYRRLALRYHPDLHPGPESGLQMRRLNEAWQMVSRQPRYRSGSAETATGRHPASTRPASRRSRSTSYASARERRAAQAAARRHSRWTWDPPRAPAHRPAPRHDEIPLRYAGCAVLIAAAAMFLFLSAGVLVRVVF
jgi:hypothetical protein